MKLTYIKQGAEPVGDGGDQYTGLDRFGRVVDQRWIKNNGTALERVDYGFTRASNRQWRWNRVASNGQDEYYNYDGLYQVAELNRGTLNGGKTAISGTPTWEEDFTYDPIGNWNAYLTKVSGITDLDQERTHNQANETVEIDGSSSSVAHDPAGNMVVVPQIADWEATNELKWDAWNRLVEVVDGETTVAVYRYDGMTRRVSKETDATRHYYYSDQWQIVEERVDDAATADRQFVWGQRYMDDLVLRDRDADHDGSLEERLYVLHDYFNPTAVAAPNGTVLERYGYDAFGLSRVMTPAFNPRGSSSYAWETRYGAYRWDAESGFYQVRYRYLHPTLGRWLSRDPIGEIGGVNLYLYVENEPVNSIDAFGEVKVKKKSKAFTLERKNTGVWGWTQEDLNFEETAATLEMDKKRNCCVVKKKPELSFTVVVEVVSSGKQSWKETAIWEKDIYPNRNVYVSSEVAKIAQAHEEERFKAWKKAFENYYGPNYEEAAAKLTAPTCDELKEKISKLLTEVKQGFLASKEAEEVALRQVEISKEGISVKRSVKKTGFGNIEVIYDISK